MFNHITKEAYVFKEPEVQTFEGRDTFVVNVVVNIPTGIKGLGKFQLLRAYGKPSEHGNKTMADYFAELKKGQRIVFDGKYEYYKRAAKGDKTKDELGEYIAIQNFRVTAEATPKPTNASDIDIPDADIPF